MFCIERQCLEWKSAFGMEVCIGMGSREQGGGGWTTLSGGIRRPKLGLACTAHVHGNQPLSAWRRGCDLGHANLQTKVRGQKFLYFVLQLYMIRATWAS